jgi:hypothetical protein
LPIPSTTIWSASDIEGWLFSIEKKKEGQAKEPGKKRRERMNGQKFEEGE